jgi:hypothetical protein
MGVSRDTFEIHILQEQKADRWQLTVSTGVATVLFEVGLIIVQRGREVALGVADLLAQYKRFWRTVRQNLLVLKTRRVSTNPSGLEL